MGLFTDGPIHTSGELQNYDSGILNVASTEGINVTSKALLAQEEIATELLLFLRRNSISDPRFLVRSRIGVCDIVITQPLRRWHAYLTLALTYRDAFNNQLNDRYEGKWKEYVEVASNAAETLFEAGVGIVHHPVPKAGQPLLTPAPANVSGTQYYIRISWVSASGQEGAASDVLQVTSGDGSVMMVRTATPPPGVDSWNVYAATDPGQMQLQNASPLLVNMAWALPVTGLSGGRPPGEGQAPEWWLIERHVLPRG
jgi:hypothetical protein